jgi:hypothetical protein
VFEGEAIVAKTYISSYTREVHKLAVFMTRYQAILRAAMVVVDPASGALFDAMLSAVVAMDGVSNVIYPIEP